MSKKTSAKKETAKVAVKKEKKVKAFKHKNISEALFAFQGEALVLPRNGEGKASNGKTYRYVTLDDLINHARPLLQKHQIVFTQLVQSDKMETRLTHAPSDTFVSSIINLGAPNQMQDYGGRITYAKRYALSAILGVSAEEDTDAAPAGIMAATSRPEVKTHDFGPNDKIIVNLNTGEARKAPDDKLVSREEVNAQIQTPKSEPFKLAKSAIDTAHSDEALTHIQEQIYRSVKLNTEEKKELIELVKARDTEINGTIR